MKFKILAITALIALIMSACAMGSKSISDTELGIRKDLNDDNLKIKDINWTAQPAGMAKKLDRSFENSPPFIPHDLTGLLPITKDMNMCVTCHMPEFAKDSGATPIPASHLYSIRFKKDKGGELSQDRYNCTQCHVPQANIDAPVKNIFKPDFRDKNGAHKSNLLEILDEGVR